MESRIMPEIDYTTLPTSNYSSTGVVYLYVTNEGHGGYPADGSTVLQIHPASANSTNFATVIGTGFTGPSGLTEDRLNGILYISDDNENNNVYSQSYSGNFTTVTNSSHSISNPNGLYYSAGQSLLYIADAGDPDDSNSTAKISSLDLGTLTQTTLAVDYSFANAVVLEEGTDNLYFTDQSGHVYEIDLSSVTLPLAGPNNGVFANSATHETLGGLVINSTGDTLYVSDYAEGSIFKVDATSGIATLLVDFGDDFSARGLVLANDDNTLFITGYDENVIIEYDLLTDTPYLFADANDGLNGPFGLLVSRYDYPVFSVPPSTGSGEVDLTITGIDIDSTTDEIQVSIANIGTDDLDPSASGTLYIYFNDDANPSDVASGHASADWTYSFSTLSDQSFRTADATANTITVVAPQTLSFGDDGDPIGSIYAYIDYLEEITESDETNNDYYWRACDGITSFHDIDDGPTNGTVTTVTDPALTYPQAIAAKDDFISQLNPGDIQVIDFEPTQGWGYGNFAGTSGDYDASGVDPSVSAFVSSPFNVAGSAASQNATGSITYVGNSSVPEAQVRFDLINTNGASSVGATVDDPGIGKIDSINDFDRGISTTETSTQFTDGQWLEFASTELNDQAGQMVVTFEYPVAAVGFYLMGREDSKNNVTLTLTMADGSSQIPADAYPIIPTGDPSTSTSNNDDGSVQFYGFISPSGAQAGCLIQSITIEEIYKSPFSRDIVSIDDLYFVTTDTTEFANYQIDLNSVTTGTTSTVDATIQTDATHYLDNVSVNYIDDEGNDTGTSSLVENGNVELEQTVDFDVVTLSAADAHVSGIQTNDATAILKHIVGLVTLTDGSVNIHAADVNNNGSIQTNDATAVLKHIVGLDSIDNFDLVDNSTGQRVTQIDGNSESIAALTIVENGDVNQSGSFDDDYTVLIDLV